MELITIRFTPTTSDYLRVAWHLSLKRLGLRALIPVLFGGVAYICVMVSNSTGGNSQTEPALVPAATYTLFLAAVASLILIAIFGVVPLLLVWRVSRQELLRSETTYQFSDEGIFAKDGDSELKQDWKYYQGVLATKGHYILRSAVNKNIGRFVPRRAFESPEQETAFRDLLKSKLKFKG